MRDTIRENHFPKLRGRIVEIYGKTMLFEKDMEMNHVTLSNKLTGKTDWKREEMIRACELLQIPLTEAYLYFF